MNRESPERDEEEPGLALDAAEETVVETADGDEAAAEMAQEAEGDGDVVGATDSEAAIEAIAATDADEEVANEESEREAEKLLEARVEAMLFSSEMPLPAPRLCELLRAEKREVLEAIDRLNVFYGDTGRAFRISGIAGGFQMVTTSEHGEVLSQLQKERVPSRLSQAALETLSIIAFKQPVTRAEVDAIRGVTASDRVLRHLIERKVVRIAGRAEAPGRPLLYGTTREFLSYFGLERLTDLPRPDELKALLAGDFPDEAVARSGLLEEDELADTDTGDSEGGASGESDAAPEFDESSDEEEAVDELDRLYDDEEDDADGDDSPHDEPPLEPSLSHSGEESDDRDGAAAP
jgi:segregation and condensation protein B